MNPCRRIARAGWFLLLAQALGSQPRSGAEPPEPASSNYLPLQSGAKWVLRNPAMASPVTFEVLRPGPDGFTLRSTTPWGSSQWTLSEHEGQFAMTAYGPNDRMMPLRDRPIYLDFSRPAGSNWSNRLGKFDLVSRTAVVHSKNRTYPDCVAVHLRAGNTNLVYTFAKGVGFVQFGEGSSAFVIDEAASVLPGASAPSATPELTSQRQTPPPASIRAPDGLVVGITPNRFANEPLTLEVMTRRFRQTLDAGAGFLVGNANWADLEPQEGQYKLDGISLLLASTADLPLSYTLRVIDNRRRALPKDLARRRWSDPVVSARLMALLDQAVPLLRTRVRWFLVGYEADAYFREHPEEARDYLELYRAAAARIKQLAPGVPVSCTFEFNGIPQLEGPLSELDRQTDFLALTYSPLNPDFTAKDPSAVPVDFAAMKKAARGRKIFLQEIGYPTSDANHSSAARQAQFYRLAFQELERDPQAFMAVNFMTLADLSDQDTERYASAIGLKTPAFKGALQTMGLFDKNGQPRESWKVIQAAIPELRKVR